MKYLIVTTTDLTESFVFAYLSPQDCQERKPFGMINGGDERIGSFYRLNVETVCCCIQATLDNNELNKAAETLLQVCDEQTEIIILTSRHKRNLVDSVEYDMENDSITKILKTAFWKKNSLGNFLTQPNVLSGFPAALLSAAEKKKKSGLLICSFFDSEYVDSRSLQGLKEAFKTLGYFKFQNEDVSLTRLKMRSQSNSTLYT